MLDVCNAAIQWCCAVGVGGLGGSHNGQSCFTPLWAYPPTYFLIHSLNHSLTDLVVVCRCAQVEGTLVAAGTLGLLRLCQRLLPCKPEAAELLLRGLQLVPSVDPEVRV
jgi:hypothetical protein